MKKQLFIFALLTAAFTNSVFGGTWYHFSNNTNGTIRANMRGNDVVRVEDVRPYDVRFIEMGSQNPTDINFYALEGSAKNKLIQYKTDGRNRTRAFEFWPVDNGKQFSVVELDAEQAENRAIRRG